MTSMLEFSAGVYPLSYGPGMDLSPVMAFTQGRLRDPPHLVRFATTQCTQAKAYPHATCNNKIGFPVKEA